MGILVVIRSIVLGWGIWRLTGHHIPIYTIPPALIIPRILHGCFRAPVMEETVYRVIICVSLAGVLGPWKRIAISGCLFGTLHVPYGNPSPENLVGGFFLAWAYLKSETILLPVMLHSVGNSFAVAGQAAGWYILNHAG